jgi:Ca2+-transporting ATPase
MAIAWKLLLLSVIICLPLLHEPFTTCALELNDWIAVMTTAATILPMLEMLKYLIIKHVPQSRACLLTHRGLG